LVTGIFDLLHVEHVRFLRAAKDLASSLALK
jgi:glycerol-3-phosphate cytidylyltransferase-like family protein